MSEAKDQVKEEQQSPGADPEDKPQDRDAADHGYDELEKEELIALLEERDKAVEELEQELEAATENHLRKAAELENVRKRFQRERTQLFETARAKALEDFLPINDDLRRTIQAIDEAEVDESFMDGVELVARKFDEVLNKYDVERIDEELVPFDVDLHDAMMRQKPENDEIGSDMVLKIIENGYRMGDRTIRHAKVIVSE